MTPVISSLAIVSLTTLESSSINSGVICGPGIRANGIISISAILSILVTRDIISSLLIAGIAADRRLSTFIDIVPPVNIAATFFLFILFPPLLLVKSITL